MRPSNEGGGEHARIPTADKPGGAAGTVPPPCRTRLLSRDAQTPRYDHRGWSGVDTASASSIAGPRCRAPSHAAMLLTHPGESAASGSMRRTAHRSKGTNGGDRIPASRISSLGLRRMNEGGGGKWGGVRQGGGVNQTSEKRWSTGGKVGDKFWKGIDELNEAKEGVPGNWSVDDRRDGGRNRDGGEKLGSQG